MTWRTDLAPALGRQVVPWGEAAGLARDCDWCALRTLRGAGPRASVGNLVWSNTKSVGMAWVDPKEASSHVMSKRTRLRHRCRHRTDAACRAAPRRDDDELSIQQLKTQDMASAERRWHGCLTMDESTEVPTARSPWGRRLRPPGMHTESLSPPIQGRAQKWLPIAQTASDQVVLGMCTRACRSRRGGWKHRASPLDCVQ